MAINAYTGLMGSGKSYEATASVVLPAVQSGRNVVTNIDGISEDAIHAYLIKKGANADKLGHIIHVSNDDVMRPEFFPDETKPDLKAIVTAGDLVVIDEAWRMWGNDKRLMPEHMQFFRMHRHYTHSDTGVSCDVALLVQSIGDLHRNLRAVVEMTARMTKLKTIGVSKGYRVELYEGAKVTMASRFDYYIRKYDPEIFPMYKSYAGGNGSEKAIDDRQNALKNPRFIAFGVIGLVGMMAGPWYLASLWSDGFGMGSPKESTDQESHPQLPLGQQPMTTSPLPNRTADSTLRVAGEVIINESRWVVVVDREGRPRLENPAFFVGKGIMQVGNIDGERVASWTGAYTVTKENKGVLD